MNFAPLRSPGSQRSSCLPPEAHPVRSIAQLAARGFALSMVFFFFSAIVAPVPAQAQNAFLRVNQVGYAEDGAKRAYLMSVNREAGNIFAVRSSDGEAEFRG